MSYCHVGISDDYADYYYFLSSLGRKTKSGSTQLFLLLLRTLPLPDHVWSLWEWLTFPAVQRE